MNKTTSASLKEIIIHTDGACSGNPGPGGYGGVLRYGKHRIEISGGYRKTTNNRMEIIAAVKALEELKYPCKVKLYTDSKYLVNAIMKGWAVRWQANNWKRTKTEYAKNSDLWEILLKLCKTHKVEFIWVKGHAANRENNCCDELAVAAKIKKNLPPDSGFENPPQIAPVHDDLF
jgi:ribonuclease HI